MSITTNVNRIRVESAAKNGTLSTQGAIGNNQIKFDTAITTNNGNLESSPVFQFRHVVIRRGDADEETNYITVVDGDGVTCTCIDDWTANPVSGDTYDVSYGLDDCATRAGCTFETDSRQWAMTKRMIVGDGTNFAYLGMGNGQILRCDDRGPTESAFRVVNAGRFDIGTIKDDLARRGAQLIFDNDADDETVCEFVNGCVAHLNDFVMVSGRFPDGVNGLVVTVGATADVQWFRSRTLGMNTPFKNRVARCKDVDGSFVLDKTEVLAMASNNGWLRDPMAETITDELAAEASTTRVRILFEE